MREAAVKIAAPHALENRAHPMDTGEIDRMRKKAAVARS
jgi:hypothetical protein